jgi:hypothetical protein
VIPRMYSTSWCNQNGRVPLRTVLTAAVRTGSPR